MKKLKFLRNIELYEDEILMFESDINYSQIWLSNGGKLIVAKTLKQLSQIVINTAFVRVNRQVMLNAKFVKTLESKQALQTAELSNGLKITFSRRRAVSAELYIQKYLIN